jgi:hypothetical protein
MNHWHHVAACFCLATLGCGTAKDVSLPGVDNTLASSGNLQVGGRFTGTGTLTSSVCDSACAPTFAESLVLTGGANALKVRIGATNYPATYDGNVVTWRAVIATGTCDGSGTQVGSVMLTDAGGTGTRVNTSRTHCSQATQSCLCSYAMSYVRLN